MMTGVQNILMQYNQINYRIEYLKTYEDFIKRPNMHYDGTLPIEKRDDNEYELSFRNVSFRYPGTADDILKNVSLDFKIGQKMALVGMNGAGKTTLIKLLLRLYEPTEGEICSMESILKNMIMRNIYRFFPWCFRNSSCSLFRWLKISQQGSRLIRGV